MPVLRIALGIVAVAASMLVAAGQDLRSPQTLQWPPPLQKAPDASPALAPADALKTFYMPPGYRLELVASEPLVKDPVAIDWDPQGRLWVIEMTGFVRDLKAPEPNLDPIGNLVVLVDKDGDGRMDERTVFADRLVLPRALKVLDTGVLVGEPGNVWWLRDTDGDLRADTRERVTNSYGLLRGNVEGNANGLYWGLDNWIHTSAAAVYLRLKHGRFEVRSTVLRGQWGLSADDSGRIYRNSNSSALHVDFVPSPYYARHPTPVRTRGSYDALRDDEDLINVVWPVRPSPGTNRAYQLGVNRPDGTLNKFTAVCAPLVYRGDRLPAELSGNVFLAEPAANLVSRVIVEDTGSTLHARKAYDRAEFLASTDERFRPVYLANGPDGALYVVDMYRGILQDRASTTEYLRDYIVSRHLDQPIELGRIYRVVHESLGRSTARVPSTASPNELVALLSHANGWWRDTAQRLLVERSDQLRQADPKAFQSIVTSLETLATGAPDWRTRVHALWTLDGVEGIQPSIVLRALEDASRDVRASAIRLAERWLDQKGHPVQAAVIKRADDADWWVRQQAAASFGALPPGLREEALATVMIRHGGDPVVMDAALSGVRGIEDALYQRLLQGTAPAGPAHEDAITMLAALTLRRADETSALQLIARLADEDRPAWQRSALLRGMEVSVLGRQMPGSPAPRRAAAVAEPPCPTCPGARAGPGGAYAFPQVRQDLETLDNAGGRGGLALRLTREPEALAALATRGGDIGSRTAAIMARVEWPGKPGVAVADALTADEQARFSAGREVYRNTCQSCHQPDGRGQDRIAPTLVGSKYALGPAEIAARIILHGKESPAGLMPPIGSTMSDADLAAVLTYIRREWGQTGSPVNTETIGSVRAATAGRIKAWTNEELSSVVR